MIHPSAPISIAIEITHRCNNACSGCANASNGRQIGDMCYWKDILDRVAPPENRCKYLELLRITGGEPTLHDSFLPIIQYIDSFEIPHVLFTNGRWPDADGILRVLGDCKHFMGLLISLHGANADAHACFSSMGRDAFNETCATIQNAAGKGLTVFTNTVLNARNCNQIDEIIELSMHLGAECAVFNRFLTHHHHLELSEETLRDAIRRIEELKAIGKGCRIGNCIPQCFIQNSSDGANAGFEHCTIAPDGAVRPDNLTRYLFGNVFNSSLEQIWRSVSAQVYRDCIPNACLTCGFLSRCRGGEKSLLIEYGLEKDPLMKTPLERSTAVSIDYDPESIPVPMYRFRKEKFGYLLVRYNWSIPFAFEAGPLIEAINGKNTISDLEKNFGNTALEVIAQLYEENFIFVRTTEA